MALVIKIENGDPSTEILQLSDRGHTRARPGTIIKWEIHTKSVETITSIDPKENSDDIWETRPHPQGNHWTGTTGSADNCGVYIYSIKWKSSATSPTHTHDPIISMRPSQFHHYIKFIVLLVAAIFSLKFLARKNKK